MTEVTELRVGVVGAGLMGRGFAELCALRGHDVRVVVSGPAAVSRDRDHLQRAFDKAVAKEKLTEAEAQAAVARVSFGSDLAGLADRQFVLEAVPEDEERKNGVFAALDEIVKDEDAVLASTTSAIPIIRLAKATARPHRVIGVHFFNPVPVLPLVELVPSLLTSDTTTAAARDFVSALGKEIVQSQDRSGFVVNALLVPYLLSAVRMVESGFATAADVDRGMTQGCAHPMGPLRLIDLIGLDIVAAVGDALYAEYREPLYAPPPLLARMVDGGLLGRKSGRGFYEYP
ncbi:3-hydroxybutyryl-CoA dehydrogenase [Actinoalloteichus hymeniacidonis]|uniref:3-hydroxyacyl-CoA dehydrogenase n=1 Tax=Actinoalloteichus hymeniacidonis TaxID=340345 RepID=A0AAC9HRQ4_9PSEU|nr:3-hydroxybutyryl-CoA dehydrogenase [Actinoalloteichus hymeniacidonis]AOS63741.1 3-hydroxyacyl-CoA dehydrogenase [Actinoalloteichus hymeniacidonis]MBB5908205.1 3-hydroxybutyryl-CoA dehydrogenase [Actinoalloteichus hymeniacidonis]